MRVLTIAIPTYNRPVEVTATIRQLFAQARIDECEIIVVDNASSVSIEEAIWSEVPEIAGKIIFHRNVSNIGLSGNLLRCMELARTERLWILADDDDLATDAVSHVLNSCSPADSPDFILFAQYAGQKGHPRTTSAKEFFNHVESWSRLGFVSTGIYRTSRLRDLMTVGTNYTYSLFPFLAMVVHGMHHCGWSAGLSGQVLVHPAHKAANTWALSSSINAYMIAELATDPDVAERLLKLASGWCLGPIGLTHDFALRQKKNDHGLPRPAYEHKLFLISSVSISLYFQSVVCRLLSYLPADLTLKVIDTVRRISGKQVQRNRGGEIVFGQI